MKSTPFRCPACMKTGACGFNGQLVFGKASAPTCDHHKGKGKPCHEGPVKMEPSK